MKGIKRIGISSLFGLSMAIALTGCGGGSELVPESSSNMVEEVTFASTSEPQVQLEGENREDIPMADFGMDGWSQLENNDIELVLHGSSSCPPIVEKVVKKEDAVIEVQLVQVSTKMACTMDLRGFWTTIYDVGTVKKLILLSENGGKPVELPKR